MGIRKRLDSLAKLDRLIDCKVAQYDRARRVDAQCGNRSLREMAKEINADIDRLVDAKREIMVLIDTTPNLSPDELEVVYGHYLDGVGFGKLAKRLYLSKTSVFRVCDRAVKKIEQHHGV